MVGDDDYIVARLPEGEKIGAITAVKGTVLLLRFSEYRSVDTESFLGMDKTKNRASRFAPACQNDVNHKS